VIAFILLGAVFALVGFALLVTAVRHKHERHPRHAAMLIGGMMVAAFGIVLAGFAIAYNAAAPLDLNAGATQ
jgi:Ca2+/H+ antiporter